VPRLGYLSMGYVGCGGWESPVRNGVRDVRDTRDGWRAVDKAWIGRERYDLDHGRGADGRCPQYVREYLVDWFVEQGMNKVRNHAT
jgi:hypothetical protein